MAEAMRRGAGGGDMRRERMVLVRPEDDENAVWAVWDPYVHGWTLAGPKDARQARWVHREDVWAGTVDTISTPERRAAWAAGAMT